MTTERMTKMERFIRSLAGRTPCSDARSAIRRHRGMTLQQAWRSATTTELHMLCAYRRFDVRCWCDCDMANAIRQRHPTPPAVVLRAYGRIK